MNKTNFAILKSAVILALASLVFAPSLSIAQPTSDATSEHSRYDKKVNDWLSTIQTIIISNDRLQFGQAVEIAAKAIKRADKKSGGENDAVAGYILAHQSLAQTNYLLVYSQLPPVKALEEAAVVYQFNEQYSGPLDASSISILTVMAQLTEARALKHAGDSAAALQKFDDAIALLGTIEGGNEYIWIVQNERMFAEEL